MIEISIERLMLLISAISAAAAIAAAFAAGCSSYTAYMSLKLHKKLIKNHVITHQIYLLIKDLMELDRLVANIAELTDEEIEKIEPLFDDCKASIGTLKFLLPNRSASSIYSYDFVTFLDITEKNKKVMASEIRLFHKILINLHE